MDLVYGSPETKMKTVCLVVDKAHSVSAWSYKGHFPLVNHLYLALPKVLRQSAIRMQLIAWHLIANFLYFKET